MSNIDFFQTGYVKTEQEIQFSPILDILKEKYSFPFSLMTFHYDMKRRGPVENVKEHKHNVFHIVLYNRGQNRFLLNSKIHKSYPGCLVITGPGENHDFSPLDAGTAAYHELTFSLENHPLNALKKNKEGYLHFSDLLACYTGRLKKEKTMPCRLSTRQFHWTEIFFESLASQLNREGERDWFKIKKTILELFGFLAGEIYGEEKKRGQKDRLDTVRDHMTQNYTNDLSLSLLAEKAGMSPEHFCRKFKSRYHTTPMAYRRQLQISAGENLLTNTGMLCKEIAAYLGFSDLFSFSKAFKKENGLSPTQYREGINGPPGIRL